MPTSLSGGGFKSYPAQLSIMNVISWDAWVTKFDDLTRTE